MTKTIIVLIAACCLVGGASMVSSASDDYNVSLVLPNANNLVRGAAVMLDGYEAGSISTIEVQDGKARVDVSMESGAKKLHEGATAKVEWKSTLGERRLVLVDGPPQNAELPDGSMLTGVQAEPVEIDQVLAALDDPTRKKLNSLVSRIQTTLDGSEKDANETLSAAGPALAALGTVLSEVGTDGEAIKQIVTQLDKTMTILQKRGANLSQIVANLDAASTSVVAERRQLGETLTKFPDLLREAGSTLSKVPSAVDATVPLLEDLAPATDRLASVSKDLKPLLIDLRPAVAQLRPTLVSLADLLRYTPGLMDTGSSTLPQVATTLKTLVPVLDFLRPYTPEVAGWASNWASAGSSYDANGHVFRMQIQAGLESSIGLSTLGGLGIAGVTQDFTPAPGQPVSQSWTDAYGSDMR